MLYTGRVKTSGGVLNVRSTPGGPVVGTLASGDEVEVLADEGAWVRISYGAMEEGYVSKQYVIFKQAASDARLVVTDEEGNAFALGSEATVRIVSGEID